MNFSAQWQALGKEAELAAAQIALGVTALGRASHARLGDYTLAFFGLTIGLERLGKLVAVTDYAIEHSGGFPPDSFLRGIGHNLTALLDHCEALSKKRQPNRAYSTRPNSVIHQNIILSLTEFGTLTRYYNLDFLIGGKGAQLSEPIGAWWSRVGEPVLSRHYSTRKRAQDDARATFMNSDLRVHVSVLHHSETGESIDNLADLIRRDLATRVVQKYGRLYVLQIVRWLSSIVSLLTYDAAYKHQMEPFLGIDEPFKCFLTDDRYFRTRKIWAIYR